LQPLRVERYISFAPGLGKTIMRRGRLNVALVKLLPLCLLGVIPKEAAGQERIYAIKGGETIELYSVWSVAHCKSRLTAAPTVEVLEGPPQVKLWVEPAMVYATRLNCTLPVTGGKLMATAGAIDQKTESKLTFRVIYKTTEGESQVARAYNVSLFPGEAKSDPAEPSKSWQDFLRDQKIAPTPPVSGSKSQSGGENTKKPKRARVASADQENPKGLSREALYRSCRQRVYKKYAWNGHDGKFYMERQVWMGMTDACVAHGGQVP
jgi:hypothetical protein